MELLQEFVEQFTYLGLITALLLGSLGVPIPEEMTIVAAGILSREEVVRWWLALPLCVLGVLVGDVVLYWIGWHWGERVLNWRAVRWVLTTPREEWLKSAYRYHTMKTVVIARHVAGLRAAAFLTAGIARVPFWRFIVADAGAALVSVPFFFWLAYVFTDHVAAILADVHRVERWIALAALLVLTGAVVLYAVRWNRRIPNAPSRPAESETQ